MVLLPPPNFTVNMGTTERPNCEVKLNKKTACEYWREPELILIECDGTQCDICIEFNIWDEQQ